MRRTCREPEAGSQAVLPERLRPRKPDAQEIARTLLEWFQHHGRDLPWRRTRDPYAIWVSEVMLQQTQVVTVIPYWQRWMQTLPNVGTLARARIEQVLKLWEGLGYYRRARHLHLAAKAIIRNHRGHLPASVGALMALPGIGSYTAGAILSMAYDLPYPAVDGNVVRVIARLYGIRAPSRSQATRSRIDQIAVSLIRAAHESRSLPVRPGRGRCGDFNESLMEIGATLCLPTKPRCDRCPLAACCRALALNIVTEVPVTSPSQPKLSNHFSVIILHRRGRFLVRQRPGSCRNAGLWEFPSSEALSPGDPSPVWVKEWLGHEEDSAPWFQLQHVITRHKIRLSIYRAPPDSPSHGAMPILDHPKIPTRWYAKRHLLDLPFTASHRRILQRIVAASLP